MAADTGHGLSLTLTGVTFNIVNLTPPQQELTDDTEFPHVGLPIGGLIPRKGGELRRWLEGNVQFELDPENAAFSKKLDGLTITAITITWPISNPANGTPASMVFDGHLRQIAKQEMATGVEQFVSYVMQPTSDVVETIEST